MNEQYVWPLVGVALGWALSLFSNALQNIAERRYKVGTLVAKLLHVHSQVLMLQHVAEIFKDNAENWEEYEPMRKRVTQRHFLEPASHVESLRDAIDEISGFYPVEARTLHNLVDMLLKSKNASLVASSKSKDLYIRMLSMYEVGLHGSEKMLRKCIRRFAYRHGVLTYVSVLWELRRRRDTAYKKNIEFAEKFSTETWEAFRRLQRGSSDQQSPPSAAEPKGHESDGDEK